VNATLSQNADPDSVRDVPRRTGPVAAGLAVALAAGLATGAGLGATEGGELVQGLIGAVLAGGLGLAALLWVRARHARTDRALRESEARFRELAEMLPEIVFEANARGILTYLNRRGTIETGYDEADLRHGLHALDLVDPRERDRVRANIGAVMSGGEVGYNEYLGVRKGGSTFPVLVHSSAVYRDGRVVGLRGTVIDITERKRTEEALVAAKREAEIASRAKSQFLAAMSHELRTPLNAVLGFSEMIRLESLGPLGNPRYAEYAKDIHESGEHLLALINDILDLEKVESGTDDLNEEWIDVADTVRAALTLVRARAEARGLTLSAEFENGLPELWADARKLKQILVNLLANATKFTEAGGRITLSVRRDEAGALAVAVRDTGVGIAPEDIPKALAPFGQVRRDPEYAQEGIGLGLPLSQALAEQHGGALEIASELGVGTTATVRLPAARLAASASVTAIRPHLPPAAE
jgi:PAS domain S-box-containing protein